MEIDKNVLSAILDAYPYPVVFCDTTHVIRYMNKNAQERYLGRTHVGNSIFNCHNEHTRAKIEEFLRRAQNGEDEMLEGINERRGEREFFTPVRDTDGTVIGYFERHEAYWDIQEAKRG